MQQNGEAHVSSALLWRRWITRVLAGLIAFSLLLHLLEFVIIFRTRAIVRDQITLLAQEIESAQQETLTLTLNVEQSVPVEASIPVQRNLTVPVSTTVTIDQVINLPIDTPLGPYSIPVPIRADVPISTTVPIVLDETVDISTTVDLVLDVPIAINTGDTPFADYLEQLRLRLLDLRGTL